MSAAQPKPAAQKMWVGERKDRSLCEIDRDVLFATFSPLWFLRDPVEHHVRVEQVSIPRQSRGILTCHAFAEVSTSSASDCQCLGCGR
jgi:hypothetical protein